MSIDRRRVLGFLAAGAAAALAGCGGGGGDGYDAPTRLVWVLNVNPEFTSTDVSFGTTVVASGLPFPGFTPPIELDFGVYSLGLRDRFSGPSLNFDGFVVDDFSPSIAVFYRHGTSARLGASPTGIINYFDSPESLIVELGDEAGGLQTVVLPFESSSAQLSSSVDCRLRVRRASDGVLVYDSGPRRRVDAIILFPADPVVGLVGVVALDYSLTDATAVTWPNIL